MLKFFGFVNITSDSFCDGGIYLDTDMSIELAVLLVDDGADVI
ncbi:dihydropteroate synthase, partial [Klebsiella quasipneumoniae]